MKRFEGRCYLIELLAILPVAIILSVFNPYVPQPPSFTVSPYFLLFITAFYGWGALGLLWLHFWRWIAPEWGSPNLLTTLAFYLHLVASLVLQSWVLTFTQGLPQAKIYRTASDGCVLSAWLIAGAILASQIVEWLLLIIKDRQLYRQPVAHLLHALVKALRISGENVVWISPLNRDAMFEQLEDAARCLENIARRIATRDLASNLWNKLAYKRRATYIRELKKWILLPKIDTPQYMEHKLRELFDLVSSNNWDGLPEADPDPGLPWWKIALSIARSLSNRPRSSPRRLHLSG